MKNTKHQTSSSVIISKNNVIHDYNIRTDVNVLNNMDFNVNKFTAS